MFLPACTSILVRSCLVQLTTTNYCTSILVRSRPCVTCCFLASSIKSFLRYGPISKHLRCSPAHLKIEGLEHEGLLSLFRSGWRGILRPSGFYIQNLPGGTKRAWFLIFKTPAEGRLDHGPLGATNVLRANTMS